jgi:hypothetical protein
VPLKVNSYALDSPHTKVNLLLQAHFSRVSLPTSDYLTVSNYLNKNSQLADKSIYTLTDFNIDSIDHLYPVLMLLSLMCKTNKTIHSYCRLKVLPPLKKKDLINLPQNGLTIRNRLCKLMTDPSLQLKRLVSQFLFILCKESVDKLIKYTGFGNAAGLLAETGLMLSGNGKCEDYSSDSEESESDEFRKYKNEINPITGRIELDDTNEEENDEILSKTIFKKAKKTDIFKGMTDEQKEYEAMKLVEAFDRLTRLNTGNIQSYLKGLISVFKLFKWWKFCYSIYIFKQI